MRHAQPRLSQAKPRQPLGRVETKPGGPSDCEAADEPEKDGAGEHLAAAGFFSIGLGAMPDMNANEVERVVEPKQNLT